MTSAGRTVPEHWRSVRRRARASSALVRTIWTHRDALLDYAPGVLINPGRERARVPVGALLTWWERWNYMQGSCPGCGAAAFGTTFGGLLGVGAVSGVCTGCARVVTRFIGGAGSAAAGAEEALQGTAYRLTLPRYGVCWQLDRPSQALVAVLQELGEST